MTDIQPRICFDVLGSLRIRVDSSTIALPGRGPRGILGFLLLEPGEQVFASELVDLVWGAERGSVAALHTTVHRLRRWLRERMSGRVHVVRTIEGYRLVAQGVEVDAVRFRDLTAAAASGPAETRIADLDAALGLWRGPVLDGAGERLDGASAVVALERARMAAVRDLTGLCVAAGQADVAVMHLRRLTKAHPFDEPLHALLIEALTADGRAAEASAAFDQLGKRLAGELGIAPSIPAPHRRPATARGRTADSVPGPQIPASRIPALLPPDTPDFTGRHREIEAVERALAPDPVRRHSAPVVVGIAGMGGVGKSALAVHVAHRIATAYSDGQLHANLRGADQAPVEPAAVLAILLRALGMDWRAIPADTAQQVSLYRSLLASRRILIVLDNAASEKQVRPLIPGSPTCAVLITSRRRLTGIEGSRWTDLGVLAPTAAVHLLRRVVDDDRVDREQAAASEIARLCGGLPLAVRIAGARLAARPNWPLTHLAAQLADQRHRLDLLTTGDLEVRASLALSHDGLDAAAKRLFGLLCLFNVPDFTVWLATALLETSVAEARRCLESMVDAQLLTVSMPDVAGQLRYQFHDLVKLYARELIAAEQSPEQRAQTLQLGFGAWLAIAERMAQQAPGPCYALIHGSAPRPRLPWDDDGLRQLDSLRWFDAERPALLSAVRQAGELLLAEVAFDLAGCLEKYFDVRGMYADWEETNTQVMAVCQAAGHALGEAVMLRGLIDVRTWTTNTHASAVMRDSRTSAEHLQMMFTRIDDRRGMSDAEVIVSWALTAQGHHEEAVDAATRALRLAEEADHPGGEARAHVALAIAYREQARHDRGLSHLGLALTIARRLGNERYEATVLQFLGIGHFETGNLDVSECRLSESLAISRRNHDNYTEALTLLALARLHLHQADPRARAEADAALTIAREYGMGHHLAEALTVLGEIALARGRAVEAARYLAESANIWCARGWLSYEAATRTLLGAAYATTDPGAAHLALTTARDIYTKLGQTDKVLEVSQLLSRQGPVPATEDGDLPVQRACG